MTTAFQANAFQNNAFQIDIASIETAASRGGYDLREIDKHSRIDRARSRAREAAHRASRELRQSLESAFADNAATAEEAATLEPEIRRSIADAQAELANVVDFERLGAEVRELRHALTTFLAAERLDRTSMAEAAKQAEQICLAVLDEEAAIVTLLI
jgi:hypothetical protein